MTLTGRQIQQIRDALLSAYTTFDSLSMMVRIELEEELAVIAGGENLRVVIFNLVTWAERNGCVDNLIVGAHNQMPGNPALHELVDQWPARTVTGASLTLTSPLVNNVRTAGPASVDVFLSYSRKDTEIMHKVQDALRAGGLAVWTDEGLEPGTASWRAAIEESLGQASAVVVLLSPNAKVSRWVDNEVGYAQTQHKVVFPILVAGDEASAVPISLINTQWVDGRNQVETVVRKRLLPTIDRLVHGHTAPPVQPARLARPWRWLVVAAVIIVVVIAGVSLALMNLYGFRFVGTTSAPSSTVAVSTVSNASSAGGTLVASSIAAVSGTSVSVSAVSATLESMVTGTHSAVSILTTTVATPSVTPTVMPSVMPTVTLIPPSIKLISLPQEDLWHIDGLAHAGAIVEVLIDEINVANTLADANGQWLLDVPISAPGGHVVKVVTEAGSFMTFVLVPIPTLTISPTLAVMLAPAAEPVQTTPATATTPLVSAATSVPTGSSPGMALATSLAKSLARPFAKPLKTPIPTLVHTATQNVALSSASSINLTPSPSHPTAPAATETTSPEAPPIPDAHSPTIPQPISSIIARPVLTAPENGAEHTYSRLTFSWSWPGDLPANWGFEIRTWQQNEPHQAIVDALMTKGIRPDSRGQYSLEVTIPPRLSQANWYWTVVVAQLEPFAVMSDEALPFSIRVDTTSTPIPDQNHTPAPTIESTETPLVEPTETQPVQPTETPPDTPTETPPDKPTDTPPDKSTDTPPDKPTDTPPDKPTDAPPDKPTDAPPDKPTDAPPDKPTDTSPDTML